MSNFPVSSVLRGTVFPALICGGLAFFGKRQAAGIIAFSVVAQIFAGMAQVWIVRKEKIFDDNTRPTLLPKLTLIGKIPTSAFVTPNQLRLERTIDQNKSKKAIEIHKILNTEGLDDNEKSNRIEELTRADNLKYLKTLHKIGFSFVVNWRSRVIDSSGHHGLVYGILLATAARAFQLQGKVTITQMSLPILLSAVTAILTTFHAYRGTPPGNTNGWNDRIIQPIDRASFYAASVSIIGILGVITFRLLPARG